MILAGFPISHCSSRPLQGCSSRPGTSYHCSRLPKNHRLLNDLIFFLRFLLLDLLERRCRLLSGAIRDTEMPSRSSDSARAQAGQHWLAQSIALSIAHNMCEISHEVPKTA